MSRELHNPRASAREAGELTAVQDTICTRMLSGESLNSICKSKGMPTKKTVYNWLLVDETFRAAYELAARLRADHLFDESVDLADQDPPRIITQGGEGTTESRVDPAAVQHMKLRVQSRQWAAARLNPRRYGDSSSVRVAVEGPARREMNDTEKVVRLMAILREHQKENGNG